MRASPTQKESILYKVVALSEVANFGTDYFLLKIKILAKCIREYTSKFANSPNTCYRLALFSLYVEGVIPVCFLKNLVKYVG